MDANTTEALKPFFWVEQQGGRADLCLNAGGFKDEIFDARSDEGFLGNGYDWQSLARVFLDEKVPHLADDIDFDSEAGMFVANSDNPAALEQFALGFRAMCEDDQTMADLFSRAEID